MHMHWARAALFAVELGCGAQRCGIGAAGRRRRGGGAGARWWAAVGGEAGGRHRARRVDDRAHVRHLHRFADHGQLVCSEALQTVPVLERCLLSVVVPACMVRCIHSACAVHARCMYVQCVCGGGGRAHVVLVGVRCHLEARRGVDDSLARGEAREGSEVVHAGVAARGGLALAKDGTLSREEVPRRVRHAVRGDRAAPGRLAR